MFLPSLVKSMKIVYQLWGLAKEKTIDWKCLIYKFSLLNDRFPAYAVICGIDAPINVYKQIYQIARKNNSLLFLWTPVFTALSKNKSVDSIVDFNHCAFLKNVSSKEDFLFLCPASIVNQNYAMHSFNNLLETGYFNGVFLDRIRYPSFQYGLSGVFSCFCSHCCTLLFEKGLSVNDMLTACKKVEQRIHRNEDNPLGLIGFNGWRWKMNDAVLQKLFDIRCEIITSSLHNIQEHYRNRKLLTALDVFTPSLCYFVGQDLLSLAKYSDFIKPMMYSRTNAPAGIPYELCVMKETLGSSTLDYFMSLHHSTNISELIINDVKNLNNIKKQKSISAHIFYGIEYNHIPPIVNTNPQNLHNDICKLRSQNVDGLVASWNISQTPMDNLASLITSLSNDNELLQENFNDYQT